MDRPPSGFSVQNLEVTWTIRLSPEPAGPASTEGPTKPQRTVTWLLDHLSVCGLVRRLFRVHRVGFTGFIGFFGAFLGSGTD